MPITLAVGEDIDSIQEAHCLLLEPELLQYFRKLQADTGVDVTFLLTVDRYGYMLLDPKQSAQIRQKLEELLGFLAIMFEESNLPEGLEPPPRVGFEADSQGEPCGREGVLTFLSHLISLIRSAEEQESSVVVVGD